mmetsp:Transcript_36564/g.84768  ORF Transcript_36564/g.84768 Transcript_36564/m.84768 type:complete len:252 (-) Transcript_36564:14-769(-)
MSPVQPLGILGFTSPPLPWALFLLAISSSRGVSPVTPPSSPEPRAKESASYGSPSVSRTNTVADTMSGNPCFVAYSCCLSRRSSRNYLGSISSSSCAWCFWPQTHGCGRSATQRCGSAMPSLTVVSLCFPLATPSSPSIQNSAATPGNSTFSPPWRLQCSSFLQSACLSREPSMRCRTEPEVLKRTDQTSNARHLERKSCCLKMSLLRRRGASRAVRSRKQWVGRTPTSHSRGSRTIAVVFGVPSLTRKGF